MSISYWLDQNSSELKTYDVIVVGAGISGLSTVYWLNKEDSLLKIALIDKGSIGSGATGRNAGFITCGSVEHFNRMVSKHGEKQALEIWRFAEENMKLLKTEIIKDQSKAIEFEQKGAYSLAATHSEMKELKDVAHFMDKQNIRVEICQSQQIMQRVGAQNFVGGIRYCNDGAVHPLKLLQLLKSQCNFDLYEHHEVISVEDHHGARKVKTQQGQFEAPIVVYCLNGYSQLMSSYFSDKIYPTRGQMLVTEPVAPFMDGPCYANFYLDYFRQLADGSLIIGGFRQLEKETEVGYSDHISDRIQEALHEFVIKHLPQFKDVSVSHRWAGVMGFSQDGEPMIGSLPNDNQIFFSGGFTGHGLGLSFHTSKCLVDLIFGRTIPDWLSAKRF